MKWMPLLCLAGALWVAAARCPARAEQAAFLEEESLRIGLSDVETERGSAKITLRCLNRMEEEKRLLFLVPKTDGVDTTFRSGWPSEEAVLEAGKETAVTLEILFAEGMEAPGEASFRVSFGGALSSAGVVFLSGGEACDPASLSAPQEQQVEETVLTPSGGMPETISVEDRISEAEAAKLDYGRAWICLREGERLLPFCQLPLRVDASGRAEAQYSGTALVFTAEPGQPLELRETRGESGTVMETGEIGMTGESVFFATMQLTVQGDEKGTFRVARQELFSSELGGRYQGIPLGLLDMAEPLLRVMEKNEAPTDTVDTRSAFVALKEPLILRLRPAAELGEIWGFCEYFFSDGTDTVHAPVLLLKADSAP